MSFLRSLFTACPVCRLMRRGRKAAKPEDLRYVLDPADLPVSGRWCPFCLVREMESGYFDPKFRRFFNRDPERSIPGEPGLIVAPADGILDVAEDARGWTMTIRIRLSDVHVQRVPIEGAVVSVERGEESAYHPSDAYRGRRVHAVTLIDSAVGCYSVKQITSHLTTRIRTYLRPGDQVSRGQRLGRILLGSTAVISLPKKIVPAAQSGARVFAGETVIARYEA